jgi:PHD/YefM family antitoxin component YafN of YafNO toxin-antitoxin module
MLYVTSTDFTKSPRTFIRRVRAKNQPLIILRHGKPLVVLAPFSWTEEEGKKPSAKS